MKQQLKKKLTFSLLGSQGKALLYTIHISEKVKRTGNLIKKRCFYEEI